MRDAQEIWKDLEETMRVYRLNKVNLSPEDLNGKYRKSFQGLKEKLKGEAEEYLAAYCLSGFQVLEDGGELVEAVNRSIQENQVGKRAGQAVFRDFSLQKLQGIAEGQRQRIQELYTAYSERHACV